VDNVEKMEEWNSYYEKVLGFVTVFSPLMSPFTHSLVERLADKHRSIKIPSGFP
jgi:hypothetical protein